MVDNIFSDAFLVVCEKEKIGRLTNSRAANKVVHEKRLVLAGANQQLAVFDPDFC